MSKTKSSIALATSLAVAAGADALRAEDFDPVHVVRSGEVHIDAAPHLAFNLFTGPGEELWVEDWNPLVLSGDGLQSGTVFITDVAETTYWIVVDYDPDALHARYARVAPESRAGTVDVQVSSDGAEGAIAAVTYELTGLSSEGNAVLLAMTEEAYLETLRGWEQAIRDADIDYEAAFARR